MTVESVRKFDDSYTESYEKGFVKRTYTIVRQVTFTTDGNNKGTGSLLQAAAAVPDTYNSAIIIASGSGNERVWLKSKKPRRKTRLQNKVFLVDCVYTNETDEVTHDANGVPVIDPTAMVKKVEFGYQQITIPTTDAILEKIQQNGVNRTIPDHLAGHVTTPGPIVNSAGVPQYDEKVDVQRTVSVQKNVRDWDNTWETFEGSINTDTVVIVETDIDGTRATHTFAPYTLRMDVVRKINTWKNGQLFFAVRFEMTENKKTWKFRNVDRGTKRRVDTALKKLDGSNYTAKEVEKGPYQEIVTEDSKGRQATLGEPIKFNGEGQEMPAPSNATPAYDPNGHIELVFKKYDETAFGPLNL